ncbi:MAG: SDR family NAD-dependent epimerase/dehydratase, partial [Alphaproteobacteria bacterium]
IEGFLLFMDTADTFTGPVNLGNPQELAIGMLAEKIIAMTGSKSRIERKPLPADDPKQRCPDIGLAKRILNWEPRVSLETGLERTIAYFDAQLAKDLAPRPQSR